MKDYLKKEIYQQKKYRDGDLLTKKSFKKIQTGLSLIFEGLDNLMQSAIDDRQISAERHQERVDELIKGSKENN